MHSTFLLEILFGFLFIHSLSAIESRSCDPVEMILASIVIGPLQDICLPISASAKEEVCIKELTCSQFDLEDLTSTFQSTNSLRMGIESISMSCSGNWIIKAMDIAVNQAVSYGGDVQMTLSNLSTSTDLVLTPSPSTPAMPDEIHFTNCDTTGAVVDIYFSGGDTIGLFLNTYVASRIDELLQTSMDWFVCDNIDPLIAKVLSHAIQDNIDPFRMNIISYSSPPPDVNMFGYLNWNTSFLAGIHRLTDSIRINSGDLLRCVIDLPKQSPKLHQFDSATESALNRIQEAMISPLSIPLSGVNFTFGDFILVVESLSISNLYSIDSIALLEPIPNSNVGLRSTATFGLLDIQLSTVMVQKDLSAECEGRSQQSYSQRAIIALTLIDVTASVDLVAALNLSTLGALYGDQLASMGCIAKAIDELYISSFVFHAVPDAISVRLLPVGSATDLEFDVAQLFNSYAELLVTDFTSMITDMLEGVGQKYVRSAININLNTVLDALKKIECDGHGNYPDVDWQKWVDSTLVASIDMLLNTFIGAEGINRAIDCITNGTGAVVVDIPTTAPMFAGFTLTIQGLDTFSEFAIAFPLADEPYNLGTAISIGACDGSNGVDTAASCVPFTIQLDGIGDDGKAISLGLMLSNVQLFADIILELDMNTLLNMQANVLATEGCAMNAVDLLGITQLSIRVEDAELLLSNRSNPVNITKLITRIIGGLLQPSAMGRINNNLEALVSDANYLCTGQNKKKSPSNSSTWWNLENKLLVSGAGFMTLAIACFLVWAISASRRKSKHDAMTSVSDTCWSLESSERFNQRSTDPSSLEITNDDCAGYTAAWLGSLFAFCINGGVGVNDVVEYDALIVHRGIPLYARVSLPLLLLTTMALFTWSNTTLLATINGTIHMGGKEIDLGALFDFSFQETVQDMWDAKVYMLAVLLVFSSGLWPYFKLGLTLATFVLPSRIMSLPLRDRLLILIDTFGKYSLVDIFLMDLLMVAFHFDIFIVPKVELVAYVVPKWGFYAFLLATMASLLLGHWALYLHRSVSETHMPSLSKDSTTMAVMDHIFHVDLCLVLSTSTCDNSSHEGSTTSRPALMESRSECTLRRHELMLTRLGKLMVIVLLACCLVTLVLGCYYRTFSFHFKGLVGYLLGPDAITPYSVFEIGKYLPSASNAPNSVGIRWIQVAFFVYAMVMPFVFVASLLSLWIVPLSIRVQRRAIVAAEVICAWSALDVFVLALVVSLFEISQFAQFIVGDSCDGLNKILKKYLDDELHGDDKCFDVTTSLKQNALLLYFSAVFLLAAGVVMLHICRTSLAQRLDRDRVHNSRQSGRGSGGGRDRERRRSNDDFLSRENEGVLRKTSMSSVCSEPKQEHDHSNDAMNGRDEIHSSEVEQDGSTPFSPLLSRQSLRSEAVSGAFSTTISTTHKQDEKDLRVVTRYSMALTHVLSLLSYFGLIRCDIILYHD